VGDGEEKRQEENGGEDTDADLETPLDGSELEVGDDGVRQIGEKDADDDVDLEEADEAASPFGGCKFRDVDGAEDGGAADAEASDEAEEEEAGPGAGESASESGDDVEDGHDAESGAAADALAEGAGEDGSDDGAVKGDGYGEAFLAFGEGVVKLEGVGDSSDDGGVEAEEEAAEGSGEGTFDEQEDGFVGEVHSGFPGFVWSKVHRVSNVLG